MRRRGLLVLLLVLLSTPATPQSTVQERASAIVIEIPVTVLGKDGRPLAGLEAKDFELYDDGKKQAINAVDVIDLSAPPAAAAPEGAAAPAPIPASARRLWLIVFDTSYTSMAGLLRARQGARDFVTSVHAAERSRGRGLALGRHGLEAPRQLHARPLAARGGDRLARHAGRRAARDRSARLRVHRPDAS